MRAKCVDGDGPRKKVPQNRNERQNLAECGKFLRNASRLNAGSEAIGTNGEMRHENVLVSVRI
jgi:hypothetical protein